MSEALKMKSDFSPPGDGFGLRSSVGALLDQARIDNERRRQATERKMEEIDRRLRHVAYLVADLYLRVVIPRLTDLASMFQNAKQPRKEGLCDRVWVDFAPTPAYPVQARLTVGMSPDPPAEKLRVNVSVVLVPVQLPYEHEAWLDLRIESPDTKGLEEFLDGRIVQFVKDYLRTGNPDSPCHENDKVTDPVCQMTFTAGEAADSLEYKGRMYYFCVEGCRRKFEAAPERYVVHVVSLKDLAPGRSPLLETTPAETPKERLLGSRLY
jgi:YHS domain-containing protein